MDATDALYFSKHSYASVIASRLVVVISLLLASTIQAFDGFLLDPVFADIASVTLTSPTMTDSRLNNLTAAFVGQQVLLSTVIANGGATGVEYILFTEIRNERDITLFLDSRWGKLDAAEEDKHNVWRPEAAGIYELRSFLASADCNPEILTPVNTRQIEVKLADINQTLVPRLEDLTQDQIGQLTREQIEEIELEESRRDQVSAEAEDADIIRIEEKERRIRNATWSDERIKEYQRSVFHFGYDSEFVMDERSYCDDARMTIDLSRGRNIEGDWQTTYAITITGRSQLEVAVVDGKVTDIVEHILNDTSTVHSFTDEQKGAIRIVLDDDRVTSVLEGKENWYVGGVRFGIFSYGYDCPDGGCGSVALGLEDNNRWSLLAFVDPTNERVIRLDIRGE